VAVKEGRPGVVVAVSANPRHLPQSIYILGIRLDVLSAADARNWLRSALRDPWDGCCRHIVTLNPEYVMAARGDEAFARAIERADLVTADGAGVVVAARLLYGERVDRVTGVELVEWLAEESAVADAPLFFLGAGEGVADETMRRLTERFPGLRSAGTWSEGRPAPEYDEPALDRIESGGARAVAVAYGAPGQMLWIERNRERLAERGVRVTIGVGGSFDYLSGMALRPPAFVRRFGLEWLFRLVREPRRWRRQSVLPVFAFHVLVAAARNGLTGGAKRR
jgi:N-acetylglucosaminyldiphosphoundecaprenol N-acetyl-beta-D-mannosaminyltransferase